MYSYTTATVASPLCKSNYISAHAHVLSQDDRDMANIAALLLLYFAVYGNARNISLVLVDDAISEVGPSVPDAHRATRTALFSLIHLQGAVCLDGSAPGYYIGRGSGSGADKWILHQGGGGWCDTAADCLERSRGVFGSSSYWNSSVDIVGGIFSDDEAVNGEFYNWNVVYLGYCDGGSFAGYLYVRVCV